MSLALKLEKTVSATPEAPRTQAFRLGLVAPAHSLRDTLISREPMHFWQVLTQLQDCVLLEWARLQKTAHDLDFLGLARHLQQKAPHVWPRAALGEAPIPENECAFRQKLERHLGGSRRTNIETHRLRATTILKEHLAYLPSLMPPPEMPLTQYFGGQAKVLNAGTLNALERKGKKQRPAAPKPSPSPPPPPSENSPAGTQRTRPNGTPTSAEGHTRPAGAPPLRPSPLGDGNRLRGQAGSTDRGSEARSDTAGIQQLRRSQERGGDVRQVGSSRTSWAGPGEGAVPGRQEGTGPARTGREEEVATAGQPRAQVQEAHFLAAGGVLEHVPSHFGGG